MSTGASSDLEGRPGLGTEGLRWGASLTLVLGLHVAVVYVMVSRQPPDVVRPAQPEAIMLELPPDPAPAQPEAPPPAPTPESTPPPMPMPPPPPPEPPMPEPSPPEPPPPDIQATPPVPTPEAVLPLPPPRPVAPPPPRPAQIRRAPPPPTRTLPAPTQPMPAAPSPAAPPAPAPPASVMTAPSSPPPNPSNANLSWRTDLVGKLARAKRYPEAARTRGEQGTAMATFTMDRAGHVLSASVTRGSGSYLLDEEAVALIHRAEPLPALPPEMPGATLTLTVPIAFALR